MYSSVVTNLKTRSRKISSIIPHSSLPHAPDPLISFRRVKLISVQIDPSFYYATLYSKTFAAAGICGKGREG